jgi:hypothetical protein
MIGVFPGSFDPLTVAHVAIADAARAAVGLDRLDLVLSRIALVKEHGGHAPLAERIAAIEAASAAGRPWMHARVTDAQLIADIAEGYDACIVGADKWHQLYDVTFYGGSVEARDRAVARLPRLVVAPRSGVALPRAGSEVVVLDVDPRHGDVSSTGVREGRHEWRA